MDDTSEETSLLSESDFGVISFQRPSFAALTSFLDAAALEIDDHLSDYHWGALATLCHVTKGLAK